MMPRTASFTNHRNHDGGLIAGGSLEDIGKFIVLVCVYSEIRPLSLGSHPSFRQPSQKLQLHRIASHAVHSLVNNWQNKVSKRLNNLLAETLPSHTVVLQLPTKDAQVLQARTNLS
ncbi:MAG: hypothetical protein ACK48Y_23490 [Planctomyces sp.]|jgi:hypothetical protein